MASKLEENKGNIRKAFERNGYKDTYINSFKPKQDIDVTNTKVFDFPKTDAVKKTSGESK